MGPELVAAIVGMVATAVSALISAVANSRWRQKSPVGDAADGTPGTHPPSRAAEADVLTRRVNEVKAELARQIGLGRTHRIASWLLTLGQFVIGGLLASTFIQQRLSPDLVGAVGVIVLASSLVRQHYQPEVAFSTARAREARLRDIVREVEDQLELRKEGDPTALTPAALRALLRTTLAEVESPDTVITPPQVGPPRTDASSATTTPLP